MTSANGFLQTKSLIGMLQSVSNVDRDVLDLKTSPAFFSVKLKESFEIY